MPSGFNSAFWRIGAIVSHANLNLDYFSSVHGFHYAVGVAIIADVSQHLNMDRGSQSRLSLKRKE